VAKNISKGESHVDLHIFDSAIQATEELKPLVDVIERFDRELGKQIRRSATSVPLNIAEGSYSQGKNRVARLYNALGSAKETCAALKVSVAWGYLDRAQISKCYSLYDMIVATLYKLVKRPNR
jgi:four helix bundle protein